MKNNYNLGNTLISGTFDNVYIRDSANIKISSGSSLYSTNLYVQNGGILTNYGTLSVSEIALVQANGYIRQNGGDFTVGTFTVDSYGTLYLDSKIIAGSVIIKENGLLTHDTKITGSELQISGDLVVETGGKIDLSGKGHGIAEGPGAGTSVGGGNAQNGSEAGSGAGHGGLGGNSDIAVGGALYGIL